MGDQSVADAPTSPSVWSSPSNVLISLPPTMPPVPPPSSGFPAPRPWPVQLPRWRRIACPAGALPAAGIAGLAGAVFVPLDRPGIGWVLAGSVAAAAVFTVDRRARRTAEAAVSTHHSAASQTMEPRPGRSAPEVPGGTTSVEGAGAQLDQSDGSSGGMVRDDAPSIPNPLSESPTATTDEHELEPPVPVADGAEMLPTGGVEPGRTDSSDSRGAVDEGASLIADPFESAHSPASGAGERAAETAGPVVIGSRSTLGDRGAEAVAAGSVFRGRAANWGRVWWTALALALLAVGAVRAAGWLFALCVVGAVVAGSLAVVGRRSVYGAWYDVIAVPIESIAGIPWVYSAFGRIGEGPARRSWRAGMSVAVTLALLAVFVPLLGGADATFATLLDALTPQVDAASVVQWIVLFAVLGLGSVGAMYLLAGPRAAATGEPSGRCLRRMEWALPVGALTILFAVFVGAQFVALFGGDDYVQRTANLTYAEYARSGFWQLSIVTILTLAVIAVVLRWAAEESAVDRAWLRILLCAIGVLTLIIVASALGRMWTYQQAYGFTVLRVLVEVCELWLGLVYLLMIAAVLRLDGTWLPRAAIGTAISTLFVLAVLNPEGLVAARNIDRWQHGENLDTLYLSRLSPDIFPALDRLPQPHRAKIVGPIRTSLDDDMWQSWNLSRANAR
ncbi:DUF4153 domain-containing protein [Nocardia sp. NPDC050630]|uniref:DUF4153 domain-containing protein n=1 Tax=Nocardia sp. NPDC050630 TaxID=3364321 RepID=UPI0037B7DB29